MSTTPREGDRASTPAPPPPPGMTPSSPNGAGTVRRPLAERRGEGGGNRSETRTEARPTATSTVSPDAAAAPRGARPETAATSGAPATAARTDRGNGPRRVRLSVSRVDPWSAMKLSFLLSVALGIMVVVAAAMVWFVLDSMHVFADIEELLVSIGSENFLQLMDYLKFDRVMSFATIVGVVDVLLLTALGTIGAFLYNIVAALVGGLHVTLTDD